MIHDSWAKELILSRQIVNVPDQKLGSNRTRVVLSHDNFSARGAARYQQPPKGNFRIDNYLAISGQATTPVEQSNSKPPSKPVMPTFASKADDQVEIGDSIIEDKYPVELTEPSELKHVKQMGEVPFEESKIIESRRESKE